MGPGNTTMQNFRLMVTIQGSEPLAGTGRGIEDGTGGDHVEPIEEEDGMCGR